MDEKKLSRIVGVILLIIAAVLAVKMLREQQAVSGEVKVHYIDVGQGDCILIESGTEDGVETMLIDCGESSESKKVKAYLDGIGIKRLNYVIGTHPHSDHMGGMSEIIKAYDVGEVIIPHLDDKDVPTTKYFTKFLEAVRDNKVKISEAKLGQTITLGEAECEFIAPNSSRYSNGNNYSVGIIMTHGAKSFIFTGDAEALAEKEMVKAGNLRNIDVYKVGHHGSDTSSCEEFLEIIKPDIAVISCGEGNSYGHPNDVTLKKLKKYTDSVYRTDLSGSIVITSDGEELKVETERKGKSK